MKYAGHVRSVQDAWSAVNAAVNRLTTAVDDLERARGAIWFPLRTARRVAEIERRISALVEWEQDQAVTRSDRRWARRPDHMRPGTLRRVG